MFTKEQIDAAFEDLKAERQALEKTKEKKKYTGEKNCIQYMLQYPNQIWHWSWEFCSKRLHNGEWLSHKAQARISELAIAHPNIVETRKVGRFHCYRLCTENMSEITNFLNS